MSEREAIAREARAQYGLITLGQALAAGLTIDQVRRRVRSDEWTLLRPGVYAISGAPPSWAKSVCAAMLAAQPEAWVSHHCAGVLWGFPGVAAEAVDILTGLDRRVRLSGVKNHRSSALFSADLTRHCGIYLTTAERTLVDLSGALGSPQLGRILDEGLRRRIMKLERLRCCASRLHGAPGRHPAKIHDLLCARLPGYDPGDSDLETDVLRTLLSAGEPLPVQQHRVRMAGRTFRIDLAYPDVKLAIELDGWDTHRTRSAFDDDRARSNALVMAGWTLVRFSSRTSAAEIVHCVRTTRAVCGQSRGA